MYYKNYSNIEQDRYKELLNILGSLSNLFSESDVPYLYYRSAENVYCRAFSADNLARSDVSVDAVKKDMGIGLKTFLQGNNKTFQKVAEFNASRPKYDSLDEKNKVLEISKLRNERINFTKRVYNLNKLIYHCVVRGEGKFFIYEDSFDSINTTKLRIIKSSQSSIYFTDGMNDYSFNMSKSTLSKKFYTNNFEDELNVKILKNPFDLLEELSYDSLNFKNEFNSDAVLLPLYSPSGRGFEKSGLNQWNASGRKRNMNEIYIPIPSWIHLNKEGFFPERDKDFTLILPNGNSLIAKVCQSGGKALMSNPNKDLGEWLLRDVLNLTEGELVTKELLDGIGIDSVIINKNNETTFTIDFKETGSYENFKERYN